MRTWIRTRALVATEELVRSRRDRHQAAAIYAGNECEHAPAEDLANDVIGHLTSTAPHLHARESSL